MSGTFSDRFIQPPWYMAASKRRLLFCNMPQIVVQHQGIPQISSPQRHFGSPKFSYPALVFGPAYVSQNLFKLIRKMYLLKAILPTSVLISKANGSIFPSWCIFPQLSWCLCGWLFFLLFMSYTESIFMYPSCYTLAHIHLLYSKHIVTQECITLHSYTFAFLSCGSEKAFNEK